MIPNENELKLFIALSAIISVVIGAIINYFFNRSLKSREVKLKLIEKLIDKRLKAYEDIIGIAKLFRLTGDMKELDKDGIMITYPAGMQNREVFENLRVGFANVINNNSHWLNIDITRELNYVQDYLGNLDRYMNGKDDISFPKVALIVKNDFTSIAHELDVLARSYIIKDVIKLKAVPTQGYHKYSSEITRKRLLETELLKNTDQIIDIGMETKISE